tara:strand:- start:1221 stop:1364 length:144 start_codon:yes stop_codon:yes gene_type:complete
MGEWRTSGGVPSQTAVVDAEQKKEKPKEKEKSPNHVKDDIVNYYEFL